MSTEPKKRLGFAAMTPEEQREIARKGGKASAAKGTGNRFTSETAKAASKKAWDKKASESIQN